MKSPETAMPGVGDILAVVIWAEIGSIKRFSSAERLASYCGLVPRENSSGGKIRFGAVRHDVNRYLKWAFVEAANSSLLNAERCGYNHISRLYQRIKPRRGHGKAKVAVARHLSEASFWMLKKGEPYREPMSSTQR
jgi:transposase